MTRITNFGRKRTYVEAGFGNYDAAETANIAESSILKKASKDGNTIADMPPEKKRKRTKKAKAHKGEVAGASASDSGAVEGGDDQIRDADNALKKRAVEGKLKKSKYKQNQNKEKKSMGASWRAKQSELRRQKRISEHAAGTICFACRKNGHTAKDCPASRLDDSLEDEAERKSTPNVGVCYRCGSKRHTLSRCKKPIDTSNPLPFAGCFVCSGKGHLASSCPQNKAKGIYPNGGSCKLCGDITHLANNCGLMKNDANTNNSLMLFVPAIGNNAGADEDDFHTLKRRTAQVEKDEKEVEKMKRTMSLKAGAHSGVIKAFGKSTVASTKKVVYF